MLKLKWDKFIKLEAKVQECGEISNSMAIITVTSFSVCICCTVVPSEQLLLSLKAKVLLLCELHAHVNVVLNE